MADGPTAGPLHGVPPIAMPEVAGGEGFANDVVRRFRSHRTQPVGVER